jgi:thiamine phosphate synthase YjbQ (UPF0047 family)
LVLAADRFHSGSWRPVHGGEVVLGTWQRVVVVDTNRENNSRTVVLSLLRG